MAAVGLRELLLGTQNPPEERSIGPSFSVSDPALAEYLGIGNRSYSGVEVSEHKAFGVAAFFRAVALVSGTIAGLPLKTYQQNADGTREEVPSFLDDPANPYPLTPFSWTELVMAHMLVRGETFLLHTFAQGGQIVGTFPIHPASVEVKWDGADKLFRVQLQGGGKKEYSTAEMTQVMGLSMDGLRGMSPLTMMRNAIGTGIAGEIASAKSFTAPLIAGLVTPEGDDWTPEEAKAIKDGLAARIGGVENAGDIAVVSRHLKFTPWMMTNEDAQFLQSREFQIVEFARMFGIPPHLLGATEKQTSWGTGVAEQNLGLQRYTLAAWTSRIEQALTRLLPAGQFCEFEYAGLLQGTPEQEIKLLIEQVKAGLLTVDEARAIRNLPPLEQAPAPKPVPVPEPSEEDSNAA